jgi:hypothetical protein
MIDLGWLGQIAFTWEFFVAVPRSGLTETRALIQPAGGNASSRRFFYSGGMNDPD